MPCLSDVNKHYYHVGHYETCTNYYQGSNQKWNKRLSLKAPNYKLA
eukprot:XP_001707772.1 Hypothetical protein GL50803_38558 [Giardia lamblia ATCC 50803]